MPLSRKISRVVLRKVVDLLETLVKRHCLGSTAEHTATTVTYLKAGKQRKTTIYFLFQAKTEALALKLRCLELEVLNATYTKDSVAALRKVKKFKSISERTWRDEMI